MSFSTFSAGVTQLVECNLAKVDVAGSNPVSRSRAKSCSSVLFLTITKLVSQNFCLTFGPRPGDYEALEHLGLKHWIGDELHPERAPENLPLKLVCCPLRMSTRNLIFTIRRDCKASFQSEC